MRKEKKLKFLEGSERWDLENKFASNGNIRMFSVFPEDKAEAGGKN